MQQVKALVDCLTIREEQVALLIARGLSNKAVARELDISHGTVKMHVHNIFHKLGIRTRYQLYSYVSGRVSLHDR
jgi:two-component system nitrate/nitrite response regulator NarL